MFDDYHTVVTLLTWDDQLEIEYFSTSQQLAKQPIAMQVHTMQLTVYVHMCTLVKSLRQNDHKYWAKTSCLERETMQSCQAFLASHHVRGVTNQT